MRYDDIQCPPYHPGMACDVDQAGNPLSTLQLANDTARVAERFRVLMEHHGDYSATFRTARQLADLSDALVTRIVDEQAS